MNLLVNPNFAFMDRAGSRRHYVAGWDSVPRFAVRAGVAVPDSGGDGYGVALQPGGRLGQFITLTDLGVSLRGGRLSFAVDGEQAAGGSLRVTLSLMGIESEGGTWSPNERGDLGDGRTFFRHGRGELIRLASVSSVSPERAGRFRIAAEGLSVDWHFEHVREVETADFRNAVGIRVDIENAGSGTVTLWHPVLTRGEQAAEAFSAGRDLPQFYRQIPRTMARLMAGEPVHILTLGSSIDRGSANPRQYLYDEDPESPAYKRPVVHDKPFVPGLVGRPDLEGYVGWFQHYFMYTGRLRLALMEKFDLPVDRILLNVLAADGSSIGESHSAFAEYTRFLSLPSANANGHADGGASWAHLHPDHFAGGRLPPPDLVVFGSGHNERIDQPDEAAVFEGAIRWFQRHYPEVEFVCAMWIRTAEDDLNRSMPALCAHYGIPFVDVGGMIQGLRESANIYALMPDGGHPQAGAHDLWFRQLEQVFEVASPLAAPLPQRHLPPRWNPYSYLWEGDVLTHEAPSERIVSGSRFVVGEGPFSIWASHEGEAVMTVAVNGEVIRQAGRGRSQAGRNSRNSSFVRGRMEPGDRYVVEVIGDRPRIHAFDEKTAPGKRYFPAGDPAWWPGREATPFASDWGHPYGERLHVLLEGDRMEVEAEGDVLSVDWLDRPEGGVFAVYVDGEHAWSQDTREPYVTHDGVSYWMENRRAVRGLSSGRHRLELRALSGEVRIIGAAFYPQTP